MFPFFSFSFLFCNQITIVSYLSSFLIFSLPTLIHHFSYLHCFLWLTWIWGILFVTDKAFFDLLFEWILNVFESTEKMVFILNLFWFTKSDSFQSPIVFLKFLVCLIKHIIVKVNWICIFWINGLTFIQEAALIAEIVLFNIFSFFKIFSWSKNTSCNQEFFED